MERWQTATKRLLPPNWEELALVLSEDVSRAAIAAYLAVEQALSEKPKPKPSFKHTFKTETWIGNKFRVIDKVTKKPKPISWTAVDHARKLFSEGTNDDIRNAWDGKENCGVYQWYEIKSKHKDPKTKPIPSLESGIARNKVHDNATLLEFLRLLSVDAVSKAWRYQAALYGGIKPETADAKKATRLNELWSEVESLLKQTQVIAEPSASAAPTQGASNGA